jgi:hypothetical protein
VCPVEYRPDGSLELITGASRTGKTVFTVGEVRAVNPLLVWDPEGQWHAMRQAAASSVAELIKGPHGRRCFVAAPSPKNFDLFCRIAWAWARLAVCTIVVEELADVTHPGKAPEAWGVLLRRGLKYGARIIGITQAPAESDKTIIRNAGRVVCFRQERAGDRAYMARELDAPLERIAALQVLQYVEKRRGEPLRDGRVSLPKLRKPRARSSR